MTVQRDYLTRLAKKAERADGRKLDEFRKIELETGVIENAEGSARVRIGKTEVLVGVKLGVGEPFPDKLDEGVLISNAEFSPLSSPKFETGRPSEDAVEFARVVDRGIRESKMIDTKKLCIKKEEKVWSVFVDTQIINHDGNLVDAAALAATAALHTAVFPEFDGERV
ncbi:MAG: RNA-binding protein, partial [Candidatus Aenigmatarchaeota archaeon]